MVDNSSEFNNERLDFERENKYLKLTISALRDKLEQIEYKYSQVIQ